MINESRKVNVKYNGRLVGYLVEIEEGRIAFQYDVEWQKNGFSISPISLPLSNKVYICSKTTFGGLYGVFADSLPDGWGELLLRRMLYKKGIDPDKINPLTKLTLISKNGLGGLEYEPANSFESNTLNCSLDELSVEAQKILENEDDGVSLDEIYQYGGSSGGARPKAHISSFGEEWIVKFPCKIDPKDIGKREFEANSLARLCGLNVNEFKMFDSNICSGYFGSRRFDRDSGKRIHMISLAALLETTHRIPNLDYYHLFQTTRLICKNDNEMYEVFKRMCFNVLYGNKDDHSKNFSFLYDEGLKTYILSPAYDLTSTPNKIEHEMTVNGNGNPSEEDMISLAKNFELSISECKKIIANMKTILKI